MEPTQTGFSLKTEIDKWQQNMFIGSLTADDASELAQHLREEVNALKVKGLTDEEAWLIARQRIGQPLVIEAEFNKVNSDFAASRNLLMLFWGGTIFMLLQSVLFVFPEFIWFIQKIMHVKLQKFFTLEQTASLLYILSAATAAFILFVLIKTNRISAWLNKVLTQRSGIICVVLVIAGSLTATLNFRTIEYSMRWGHDGIVAQLDEPLEVLGFLLYGSLVFCTAWFTMRYRKQEFKNLKEFSKDLNWSVCLMIGILFELIVSFCNTLHFAPLKYVLILLLFGWGGHLVKHSKNTWLNLFMLQLCALYFCFCVGYYSAHQPFYLIAAEYLTTITAMMIGVIVRQRNYAQFLPA